MPDKPVTVAAYAAGASLAAITLFYVFGPTFFIDGDGSTNDGRKRTIVGLFNPANDCFINSVLQALAGLGDLRLYLIREIHRRELDGAEIFDTLPLVLKKGEKPEKVIGLQKGPVTRALKEMLDALNERPIYRKTITARPMIEALERAFNTRISRNQQDAQEFLQIVLERLCDEYHAAERARKHSLNQETGVASQANEEKDSEEQNGTIGSISVGGNQGFPFEGRIESQIQCMYCGFKTKPSVSNFVSLTLNVPQKNAVSLDNCFDILLKTEDIDDYMCDKCRLKHALEWKSSQLAKTQDTREVDKLRRDMSALEKALVDDPERAPEGVELPGSNEAPRRKIKKYMRITVFPKVIAIHLSRSVYDNRSHSTKNMAKVTYTERLRLGGILNEHWYRLLGVVCHKGNHNSGHYESFRRSHLYAPFSTPDAFSAYAAASRGTSAQPSAAPSPAIKSTPVTESTSTTSVSSNSLTNNTSRPSTAAASKEIITPATSSTNSAVPNLHRTVTQMSRPQIQSHETNGRFRKKKKTNDRWWRVSDDKVKEARTSECLGMQREVYLLFYELERPGDSVGS